jgi:hypothetical protein
MSEVLGTYIFEILYYIFDKIHAANYKKTCIVVVGFFFMYSHKPIYKQYTFDLIK